MSTERQLLIARIQELLAREPWYPGSTDERWAWPCRYLLRFSIPDDCSISTKHRRDLLKQLNPATYDYEQHSPEQLLSIFEVFVHAAYQQR